MKRNIIILTGLIRSGKTTLLMKWIEKHPLSRGILTPDIDGVRFFLHFPEKQLIKMQVSEDKNDTVKIGRFLFSKESFDNVNQLLINDIKTLESNWIVIDEIGVLELKEKGLFPAFQFALKNDHCNIIIVVRDKLLNRVIEKFGLEEARLIYKEDLETFF